MKSLSSDIFNNEFTVHFDGDRSGNSTPRQTPGVLYSLVSPTPVKAPRLLAWSDDLATQLGIAQPGENDVSVLAGNLVTPSMQPYAACYAGHQFGHWAGQLGDGRAITLGEWPAPDGKSWELQLKGPGLTPYSRRADGRAVLRSSLREYVLSEAMHYLGVPTTRALSLVGTGEDVLRDMFYDGNAAYEPGAIVMRVAPSFLRFGNFEILNARKEIDNLRKLVDWAIDKNYPHIQGEDRVMQWFKEVVDRTAALMVEWARVGFVHGVMNTDNMSILGLTIDYGPFSFLDEYDPEFTPNTTDLPGRRYAFGQQAPISQWNLGCLAGAIAPLFDNTEGLVAVLQGYEDLYWDKYYKMMCGKLGFEALSEEATYIIVELNKLLNAVKPDMTIFYQLLITMPDEVNSTEQVLEHFKESFYATSNTEDAKALFELMKRYGQLRSKSNNRQAAIEQMNKSNPRFIPRNYLLHQAIEEIQNEGTDTVFKKLLESIKDPYSDKFDEFFVKRPDWAGQKAGCSMLSCSS
ncbi:MAG: YdiU family protein [Sphingobacteriales bacterium]|nr:MAG: YdiU family protein [Sphingobacteriales bacterium]